MTSPDAAERCAPAATAPLLATPQAKRECIACGLMEAPGHVDMHWWDIGEAAGWVCTFCNFGRAPNNDPVETYRNIRRRLSHGP